MIEGDRVDALPRCQVKAIAKVDHRPDDDGVFECPRARPLRRPFQGSLVVGLPEIDAGPEPVVRLVAGYECFAADHPFGGLTVAAVIAEDEARPETPHLSVGFRTRPPP